MPFARLSCSKLSRLKKRAICFRACYHALCLGCRFGTFTPRHRPERQARNPRSGEPLTVAATTLPAFTAGAQRPLRVPSSGMLVPAGVLPMRRKAPHVGWKGACSGTGKNFKETVKGASSAGTQVPDVAQEV